MTPAGHGRADLDLGRPRRRAPDLESYGQLLPGGEEEAAARLGAFLQPTEQPQLEAAPEPPTTADDRSQTPARQEAPSSRTGDPTVA
jgi:hypothetical protein